MGRPRGGGVAAARNAAGDGVRGVGGLELECRPDGRQPHRRHQRLCQARLAARRGRGVRSDAGRGDAAGARAEGLYSGPAYQLINGFLRQVARLDGAHRVALALMLSAFTATVGHVCRAIRKLAAIATPEEAAAPLYRGVRTASCQTRSGWPTSRDWCVRRTRRSCRRAGTEDHVRVHGRRHQRAVGARAQGRGRHRLPQRSPDLVLSQFAEEDGCSTRRACFGEASRRRRSSVKSPKPSPGKNSRLRKASTVAMAQQAVLVDAG